MGRQVGPILSAGKIWAEAWLRILGSQALGHLVHVCASSSWKDPTDDIVAILPALLGSTSGERENSRTVTQVGTDFLSLSELTYEPPFRPMVETT